MDGDCADGNRPDGAWGVGGADATGGGDRMALGERIILGTARLWFLGSRHRAAAPCRVSGGDATTPPPAETAAAQLSYLLNILFAEVDHPLDFRCVTCNLLGRDEKRFLNALAAFQAGRDAEGEAILATWMSAVAVPSAARLARDLAETLGAVALTLRRRDEDGEEDGGGSDNRLG